MKAGSRFLTAILVSGGFFLIKTSLYHLLKVEGQLHDCRYELSVSVGNNVLTRTHEAVALGTTSITKDRYLQATATTQHEISATNVSPNSMDRIVVMGKINGEDTAWVRKLPTLVLPKAWNLFI